LISSSFILWLRNTKTPEQTTNFTVSQAEPDQTRQANASLLMGVFDDDTCLLEEELRRFLVKSGFVEEVIDLYINNERRLLTETTSDTDSRHPSGRVNTGEWQQLGTSLPAGYFG
jgi:hypothetical protein